MACEWDAQAVCDEVQAGSYAAVVSAPEAPVQEPAPLPQRRTG